MTTNMFPTKASKGDFDEKPGVYCVKNIKLAAEGRNLIDWAAVSYTHLTLPTIYSV